MISYRAIRAGHKKKELEVGLMIKTRRLGPDRLFSLGLAAAICYMGHKGSRSIRGWGKAPVMLRFSCEHCGAKFRVAEQSAGQLATCRKCGAKILVPSADGSGSSGSPASPAGPADAMADLLTALSTAHTPPDGAAPSAKADVPADAPAPAAAIPPPIPAVPQPQAPQAAAAQPQAVAPPIPVVPQPQAPQAAAAQPQAVAPLAEPDDVPMARPAEPDDVPMARPVRSKVPLLIGLGVIVLAAIAVGAGFVLLKPPAYDLEKLKASYRQIRALEAKALGDGAAGAGKTDAEIIAGLDEKALIIAKDSLKEADSRIKDLKKQLGQLKGAMGKDSALRQLAEAANLEAEIIHKRLQAADEELWPRPGDLAAMYKRMKSSVPYIETLTTSHGREAKASASGFLIKPEGLGYLVVTNRHVVDDAPNGYTVRFLPPGRLLKDRSDDIKVKPEEVIEVHRNEDLAIMKLPPEAAAIIEKLKVRPLRLGRNLEVGESVWVVGNPGAGAEGVLQQSMVPGMVSSIIELKPDDPTLFRLAAPINKGNSGGPVLDKDGRVVGIVSRFIPDMQQMNFAVHYHMLDDLIDVMSGKVKSPDLVSLNPQEILRVVMPQKQLTKDLDDAVATWAAKGFSRRPWTGRDSNSYLIMPPLEEGMIELPMIVRRFTAKKGNTYSIVSVSGKTGEFDIEVYAGPGDAEPRTRRKGRPESRPEIKPVFVHKADGTSKAIGPKGDVFRDDFVADADGTYVVRFVKAIQKRELEGAAPWATHICTCVVELSGVQWKPAQTQEAPKKPAATQEAPKKPAATQEAPRKPAATREAPKKPAATREAPKKPAATREAPE
jgi:S1-C subfamily serine protease/DNA-directed RNA polymerase subunit RPC12/RpoP